MPEMPRPHLPIRVSRTVPSDPRRQDGCRAAGLRSMRMPVSGPFRPGTMPERLAPARPHDDASAYHPGWKKDAVSRESMFLLVMLHWPRTPNPDMTGWQMKALIRLLC